MRSLAAVLVLAVLVALPAVAQQLPVSFARLANTPSGRALLEPAAVAVDALDSADPWRATALDLLRFDYEQGVAFTGSGLVFSSRSSLARTSLGCADPLNPAVPCYDEEGRNPFAIPADERLRGFNHIGDIDAGRAGPASGFVFAPLETSSPRTVRGYAAYDLVTLQPAGKLIEETPHNNHSWVTVDPSGSWLLAADRGVNPIRIHAIERDEASVRIVRRTDLDVSVTSDGRLPNMNGCAFADPLRLYCTDWESEGIERDARTVVYRLDLTAFVGTAGAAAAARRVLHVKLTPRHTPGVPYGMETEGLTFYRRDPAGPAEMHVLVRGEALAWVYYLHLAPAAR